MTKLSIFKAIPAKLVMAALASIALTPAQETKETPKPQAVPKPGCCVQQVYQVKHANVGDLYRLLFTRPGQDQMLDMRFSESLKAISVYGASQEVRSIMANLQALDVPSRGGIATGSNAEITFWLIAASTSNEAMGDPLPAEVLPALKSVANPFGYKSFSLMDSAVARIKEGGTFRVRGNATPPNPKLVSRTVAEFTVNSESVRIEGAGESRTVSLSNFSFRVQVPYCADADCAKIDRAGVDFVNASLSVREGQKVVIGKSKMDGSTKDLILIVSARVVD